MTCRVSLWFLPPRRPFKTADLSEFRGFSSVFTALPDLQIYFQTHVILIEYHVLTGSVKVNTCKIQGHSIVKLSESRITRITRIFKSLRSRILMKFGEFRGELNGSALKFSLTSCANPCIMYTNFRRVHGFCATYLSSRRSLEIFDKTLKGIRENTQIFTPKLCDLVY